MFKNLVILMLSFIILYLTNPTEDKFVDYYSQKVEEMKTDGDWKDKIVLGGKQLNVRMNVKKEDKVIYTIYTVNFMGEEEKYLGIATKFINITKTREKAEEAKKKAEELKDDVKEGAEKLKKDL